MPEEKSAARPGPRTGVLRTPESRFQFIDDYPWTPHYFEVEPGLSMAFVDTGPRDAAETLLLLHGEPMWGYLYRKMIPVFERAGFRVVVPDLIGFGRSDKPVDGKAYTYSNHVGWVTRLLEHLDLRRMTVFGQDWGGLIGGRVLAENIERFARAVFSNTDLPGSSMPGLPGLEPQGPLPPEVLQAQFGIDWRAMLGDGNVIDPEKVRASVAASNPLYFLSWRVYSQAVDVLLPSRIVPGWCATPVSAAALRAYDAPFPSDEYAAGARRFPLLVPITPDDPERKRNDAAWAVLERWQGPVLTLWGDACPFTFASKGKAYRERMPGAKAPGIEHKVYAASHFIQEDLGEVVAEEMTRFIRQFPVA
ncbi:MAG: alpha/beta fold hydrolase [Gammaproteobacteria bacterium]|nr:alpha/beta fold hydrolase [Gammaproteobacteria bacterium]